MSLTNNTGSRVTSYEEPLTGQSGPVNLASKMAPKEKTTSKDKKRRQKKIRDIRTNRDVQPHRILIQQENPFLVPIDPRFSKRTSQSGPVNLASKMAPKEKTTSKDKKRRKKKIRDIRTNRDVQPHSDSARDPDWG